MSAGSAEGNCGSLTFLFPTVYRAKASPGARTPFKGSREKPLDDKGGAELFVVLYVW